MADRGGAVTDPALKGSLADGLHPAGAVLSGGSEDVGVVGRAHAEGAHGFLGARL